MTAKLTWSKDRAADEWVGTLDGEIVARAYRRYGTPTGYYAAWHGSLCGSLSRPDHRGAYYPSTLREFKEMAGKIHASQQAETAETRSTS